MSTVDTAAPAQTEADVQRALRAERGKAFGKAIGRALVNTLVTLVVVLALWQAVVSLTGVSHYVAKGPLDVWRYLVVGNPAKPAQTAEAHRAVLAPLLGRTLDRTLRSAVSRSDSHGVATASVIMPTSRMPWPVSTPARLKKPSSRLP